MLRDEQVWLPGSFTKNYGWGKISDGLRLLHETIRVGFNGKVEDVHRAQFRISVESLGKPDYIPLQFFLFNRIGGNEEFVVADELVFQAITFEHNDQFDKLALFAFLLSLVGRWKGASQHQRRPAEWARTYVSSELAGKFQWDSSRISADSIEHFVRADPRYKAQSARKLATNLNYLFKIGRVSEYATGKVERWWVNALFLTLDRLSIDQSLPTENSERSLRDQLLASGFNQISGKRTMAKDVATSRLLELYSVCGGLARFSESLTKGRLDQLWPYLPAYHSNDPRPVVAVSMSDPSINKTIPRICAQIAKEIANFEVMDVEDFAELDIGSFVAENTARALQALHNRGISSRISAEELMKLTRPK